MPFVPLRDGRELHVRLVGRGMPVLLLPGLGMSSASWLPFVLPYARRYRFVLPDFRGFGRSSQLRIERADVFESHALDVRDVIAHFGLRDYLLGGISLGGTTALHMNRDGGLEGARGYLHIDQSPCVGNRDGWPHGLFGVRQEERFAEIRTLDEILRRHSGATRLGELPLPDRTRAAASLASIATWVAGASEGAKHVLRPLLLAPLLARHFPLSHLDDVRTYVSAYLAGGHDYRPSLASLALPVTLMIGMRSPLYPPEGQLAIAERAPNVRVVRFERSGHIPLLDEPRKFLRELGRFLDEGAGADRSVATRPA